MEPLIIVLQYIGRILTVSVLGALALLAIAGIAVVIARANDCCRDSPDGEHEYAHTRTPEGWCLTCAFCGRMTTGIDAFRREA